MHRSLTGAAVLAGVLSGLLLGALPATSVQPADGLPEKVRLAEQITEVEVLDAVPAMLRDGTIETRYTFATITPMKGVMPFIQEVRMPGGTVAGRGLFLPGMPSLRPGERVVLFLSSPSPGKGWRMPVGLAGGAYAVSGQGRERQVAAAAGASAQGETGVQDYDAFIARIQLEVAAQQ